MAFAGIAGICRKCADVAAVNIGTSDGKLPHFHSKTSALSFRGFRTFFHDFLCFRLKTSLLSPCFHGNSLYVFPFLARPFPVLSA